MRRIPPPWTPFFGLLLLAAPAWADDCPADPDKTDPGQCGCGNPDTDTDGDGLADCVDGCPADPDKGDFGVCGCGVEDADSDGDGVPDCVDGCPEDPNKGDFGVCGCGVADVDSDGDGTADCVDGCPEDPAKADFGVCGCGVVDVDGDGDGIPDCVDGCPADPNKGDFGVCGCGEVDLDSDGDGTPDCVDFCPEDPTRIDGPCDDKDPEDPVCDADTDGDGVCDADDNEMACTSLVRAHGLIVDLRRGEKGLMHLKGRFALNGWTEVDLRADGIAVTVNGRTFGASGRDLRVRGREATARGHVRGGSWRLEVDLDRLTWQLDAAGRAVEGLDLDDTLSVGLGLGAQSSHELIPINLRGRRHISRWHFERPAAQLCPCPDGVSRRSCPPRRPRVCR